MEESGANDVTIRPIASAVKVVRDVSGAVAKVDLLCLPKENKTLTRVITNGTGRQ